MLSVRLFACPNLCDPMGCGPPGSSVHGISPGKRTGGRCHSLLQGIFLTQGLNPGLLHCRRILYHLATRAAPGKGKSGLISQSLGPTLRCANLTLPLPAPWPPAVTVLGPASELSCFCEFFYSNNSCSSFKLISISASWSPCSLSP